MNVFKDDILNTIRNSIIILDSELRVIYANLSFYNDFKTNANKTENKLIYELGNGQWNIPELRKLLEEILPKEKTMFNFRVSHNFQNIGQKVMLINARQLKDGKRPEKFIFVAIEDVTEEEKAKELEVSSKILQSKLADSEKFHKIVIDRELKMIELKKRITELEKNASAR